MPVTGAKPKADRSQVRHRIDPVHEWTEVVEEPFLGAPKLRPRSAGGLSVMEVGAANSTDWPAATLGWWRAISRMPHAKLWDEAAWEFAMDSAEIHARTMEAWRGYSGAEIRAREKVMGTLPDYRRDLRIRYVKAADVVERQADAGNVVSIKSLRAL
jgi:hypothetical protein